MYPIVFVKTMGIEHPEMERNRKYFRVYAKTRKKKIIKDSIVPGLHKVDQVEWETKTFILRRYKSHSTLPACQLSCWLKRMLFR